MPAYDECSMYDVCCRNKTCGHGKSPVMRYSIDIVSETGVPFHVVLGPRTNIYGEGVYGGRPVVAFYDRRYADFDNGQFVSDYLPSTLHDHTGFGLDLCGGVEDWRIGLDNLNLVQTWLGLLVNHWES